MADHGLGKDTVDRPGHTEFHPTCFRQEDAAPPGIQTLDADTAPGKTETVPDTLATRLGIATNPREEPAEGGIEIRQRALLRILGNCLYEIEFGTQRGQLACLGDKVKPAAGGAAILSPMAAALFERQVPNQSEDAGMLAEFEGLRASRLQAKGRTPADHPYGLVQNGYEINVNKKRRQFLPALKDRVSLASIGWSRSPACS